MVGKSPSQADTEILQALWERGRATVREIHDDILEHRQVGYTTTLKQVQRLEDKGLVERVESGGRSHRFRATAKPHRTRSALLDRLLRTAFDGSTGALVLHALGRKKPSKEQIAEIRALLDRLDGE